MTSLTPLQKISAFFLSLGLMAGLFMLWTVILPTLFDWNGMIFFIGLITSILAAIGVVLYIIHEVTED